MDGYAVRAGDVATAAKDAPVALTVVGETRAGDVAGRALGVGEAVRIMTGAPIPPGADSVVPVEDTDAEATPGQVLVFSHDAPGRHVRPGGQDMREGEEVLASGTSLGSGQMGLIAAAGAKTVLVHRRPRVGILSNGDELASADDFRRVLVGKAIPETNSATLAAAISASGGIPVTLEIARDNRESILTQVDAARKQRADILLTSGGASMGEKDLLKRVLEEIGFDLDFWRVRIRPGTPFSFGVLPEAGDTPPLPVFGLPGNPASSFVTFQIFARPFLLALAGHRRIHRPMLTATAGDAFESPPHLTHFFRVNLRGDPAEPSARLTGPQGSGLVRGGGLARGLAVVPEGVSLVNPGERIRVILLDEMGLGGNRPGF
jgi:molybdopterin molybdotransferase